MAHSILPGRVTRPPLTRLVHMKYLAVVTASCCDFIGHVLLQYSDCHLSSGARWDCFSYRPSLPSHHSTSRPNSAVLHSAQLLSGENYKKIAKYVDNQRETVQKRQAGFGKIYFLCKLPLPVLAHSAVTGRSLSQPRNRTFCTGNVSIIRVHRRTQH